MNITLLDGGLGQELVHRSGVSNSPLWATQIMLDNPGLVAAVHRDFAAAGATVSTTNTYAIHHDRFVGTPLADAFQSLHDAALGEVRTAGSVAPGGRIAGAIGPLAGSYRPDKHPDHATAVPLYAEKVALLAPHVDIMLFETVASIAHARAVLDAAHGAGKPVWLALTLDDTDGTRLRSGEALAEAVALTGYDAILANCSAPEALDTAMPIFARQDRPFGGYANGFTMITSDFLQDKATVDALTARRDLTPEIYADFALGWVDAGATIVGGCCEVGPAHIAAIATRLRAAGHTIN